MKTFSLVAMLLFAISVFSQHTISGTFAPSSDYDYALLYYATPSGAVFIDQSEFDDNGNFKITLNQEAPTGVYKLVYALPAIENNFDIIYNGEEDVTLKFSLDKGLEFVSSNENKLWASYTKSMELVNRTLSNFYAQESTDQKAYNDIIKTQKETQEAFEAASKDHMAHVFITANRSYIPEEYEDLSTYSKHLKEHYLSHIDFNNILLQSSDFLTERIFSYLFGMTHKASFSSYKKDLDQLLVYMKPMNKPIKTALLTLIWQRFATMGNEDAANYLTDTYLLELAKETLNTKLANHLIGYKNTTLGNLPENFDISLHQDGKTTQTTLYDLNLNTNYLLIFWSSTCSHCLDELPHVRDLVANKPDYTVIAIGIEEDETLWRETIKNYPEFIHVLGLGKWDNPIAMAYNVVGTPSYFILDKDKKIKHKPQDLESLIKNLKE